MIQNIMRTKKVICAHEAAHAALCHYHNIPVHSVEVYEEEINGKRFPDGKCWCDLSDCSDKGKLQMYCSGFALEWREVKDLDIYPKFIIRRNRSRGHKDPDDCEKIDDLLKLTEPAQSKKHVVKLFRDTWEIMKNHYLPVIMTIAEELEKRGFLNREQVKEIFDEAFPLGSPRDDFDNDNDEAA